MRDILQYPWVNSVVIRSTLIFRFLSILTLRILEIFWNLYLILKRMCNGTAVISRPLNISYWLHWEISYLFPFELKGIRSWWQFSLRFWTKWISIWFIIERKTVIMIISHSMWKEMEILFSQCMQTYFTTWKS